MSSHPGKLTDDRVLPARMSMSDVRSAGRALGIAAITAATFILCWPSTASLIELWTDAGDSSYTHGFLVLAICAFLLFRERHSLNAALARPQLFSSLVLLFLLGAMWLVLIRAGIRTGHQVLLPALAFVAIWGTFGTAVAKRAAFPIGYLYFAIPAWDFFTPPLQVLTTEVTHVLLRVVGIPAYVVGNQVQLSAGVFEIAEGCAGLHFFVVALALAALYGELNRDSLKVRIQLLALAGVAGLFSNWLRVFTIVVAGHVTNMQHYLVRVEHYRFGWLVFAVVIAGFFLIARRLPVSAAEEPQGSAARGLPKKPSVRVWGIAAVALAVIAIFPALNTVKPVAAAAIAQQRLLPSSPEGWVGPMTLTDVWSPRFVGSDAEETGSYRTERGQVDVYSAMYVYQEQGKELIGYRNSVLGDEWSLMRAHEVEGRKAKELEVRSGATTALIWYFYEIGEWRTTSDLFAQLGYGSQTLLGRPVSKVMAFRAICSGPDDCETARANLSAFLDRIDLNSGR